MYQALTQIDEVAQQNAALVEEAAANRSLNEQSQRLMQTMAVVKVTYAA